MDYEIIVEVNSDGANVLLWRRWQLLSLLSDNGWSDTELEVFNDRLRPDAIIHTERKGDSKRSYHVKMFKAHARS